MAFLAAETNCTEVARNCPPAGLCWATKAAQTTPNHVFKKGSHPRVCLGTQSTNSASLTLQQARKPSENLIFEPGLLLLLYGSLDETRLFKGDRPIPTILGLTSVGLLAAVNVLPKLCPVGCTTGFLVFLNEPTFCPSLTSQKNVQLESQSNCPSWKKTIFHIYWIYCASLLMIKIVSFPPNHRLFQY